MYRLNKNTSVLTLTFLRANTADDKMKCQNLFVREMINMFQNAVCWKFYQAMLNVNSQLFAPCLLLTQLYIASHKWDIVKQCRPWSDAAKRGIYFHEICLYGWGQSSRDH